MALVVFLRIVSEFVTVDEADADGTADFLKSLRTQVRAAIPTYRAIS